MTSMPHTKSSITCSLSKGLTVYLAEHLKKSFPAFQKLLDALMPFHEAISASGSLRLSLILKGATSFLSLT